MSTVYVNQLQSDIFDALSYPNHPYDGNYVWEGATPSAGVISAVQALPQSSANEFYGTDLTSDEFGLALQALVTGDQWTALLSWQETEYAKARCVAYQADPVLMAAVYEALFNGTGFSASRSLAQAALTGAGLPSS
jgi:hypothetical protein